MFFFLAISVFDATGKIPSGVLRGHTTSLGSYDSCLAIHGRIPRNIVIGALNKTASRYPREFDTKYCRATMTLDPSVLGGLVSSKSLEINFFYIITVMIKIYQLLWYIIICVDSYFLNWVLWIPITTNWNFLICLWTNPEKIKIITSLYSRHW